MAAVRFGECVQGRIRQIPPILLARGSFTGRVVLFALVRECNDVMSISRTTRGGCVIQENPKCVLRLYGAAE